MNTYRLPYHALVVAAVMLSACGGDDDSSDLVVSADAEVSVTRGASASLSVALTRDDALSGASLTLSTSDLPSGVTATFDNASTTADSALLTLTAGFDADLGTTPVTISAAAEDGTTASTTLSLTVVEAAPITLTGYVRNGQGYGVSSAIVHVFGAGATTSLDAVSGADGSFTVENVQTPYDAVTIRDDQTEVFIGMSSSTPTLATILSPVTAARTVQIAGTVTRASGTTAKTAINIETANDNRYVSPVDTSYSTTIVPPPSGTTVNASVSAVQYEVDADDNVSSYVGYKELAVNLSTAAINSVDIAPTGAIASHNLTVNASGAAGYTAASAQLSWLSGPGTFLGLASFVSPAASVPTFVAPTDDRIPMSVQMTFSNAVAGAFRTSTVKSTTTSLNLVVPAGIETASPENGAINVDASDVFSCEVVDGASYLFIIWQEAKAIRVMSATPSVSIARLAELGVTLQAAKTYSFQAAAVEGGANEPFGLHRVLVSELIKLDGAGYRATLERTFATTPD